MDLFVLMPSGNIQRVRQRYSNALLYLPAQAQSTSFNDLPLELVVHIASFATYEDIVVLSFTAHALYDLCSTQALWKAIHPPPLLVNYDGLSMYDTFCKHKQAAFVLSAIWNRIKLIHPGLLLNPGTAGDPVGALLERDLYFDIN